MKKRIYILILLLFVTMGIDKARAEDWTPNGSTTNTGANFGGCSGESCFNDDEKMYGLRVSLVDSSGNIASGTKQINLWSDWAIANSSKIETRKINKKTLNLYKFSFRDTYGNGNVDNYIVEGLFPKKWYVSSQPNPIFDYGKVLSNLSGKTTGEYGNPDVLKYIIGLLFNNNIDIENFDWSIYNDYYVKFEPLMVETFWGTYYSGKSYTIQGTVKEVYEKIDDIYSKCSNCRGSKPAYWAEVWNPYLNSLFLQNPVFKKKAAPVGEFFPGSSCQIFLYYDGDTRILDYFNRPNEYFSQGNSCYGRKNEYGQYGFGLGVIKVSDTGISTVIPDKPSLIIKKYANDPNIDPNDIEYDKQAYFQIQKCNSVENGKCKSESNWKKIYDNVGYKSWIGKNYKKEGKNDSNIVTGGLYRIKELSVPNGVKVYYKFNGALNPTDLGANWFEFTLSSGSNSINVYNYSTVKSCENYVIDIFNRYNEASYRRFYLKKLYTETYPESNNLLAFDENAEYINGSLAMDYDVAHNMCQHSNPDDDDETNNPEIKCIGDSLLGTILKNDTKIYPYDYSYKYFLNNNNSFKMDFGGGNEIDCSISYKIINNNFKEEKVQTLGMLWKDGPGKLSTRINCYGFVSGRYRRITSEQINSLVNDIVGKTPKLNMKITSKDDIEQNISALLQSSDFSTSANINYIEADGQGYTEIEYSSTSEFQMSYEIEWFSQFGSTDGIVYPNVRDSNNYEKIGGGFPIASNDTEGTKEGNLSVDFKGKKISTVCNYTVENGITTTDGGNPNDYEYNLEVRIIDTLNPFPGRNGTGRIIGSNWCMAGYIGKKLNGKIIGDYNEDEVVNSEDALFLSQNINKEIRNKYSDFNGDGQVNNDDVEILFKYSTDLKVSCSYNSDNSFIKDYISKKKNSSNSTKTPKYSFILNASDIKKIKDYNDRHSYTDIRKESFDSNGNNWLSTFISNVLSGRPLDEEKNDVLSTNTNYGCYYDRVQSNPKKRC